MSGTRSVFEEFDPATIDTALKRLDPEQRQRVAAFLAASARYLGVSDGREHGQRRPGPVCEAVAAPGWGLASGSTRCRVSA